MINLLSRYISVGIVNTALHWAVFSFMVYIMKYDQAVSNVLAFLIAVTFSFFANAKFTFSAKATSRRYVLFVGFMGLLSFISGQVSDHYHIPPLITLIEFSSISLVCGFLYSRFIVFRDPK
ncbi:MULTISPECIES: GtrA family protein [Citrobacter]|jgi:putative flippase GtrA|uniref:GtrA family protein n=1 Tax=Citrobacter sp. wls718 TaxID=2576418 RepID=UPI000E00EA49|nr:MULTISPECIES: GtrA family protein [Citrobacter]STE17599.1 prophage-encoded bactoprenol-linked glucose translocase [Escherichia coli]QLW75359.1 GtrA family protein [Citrobacter freundii]QMJ03027.1 GtrA family protein [Citrobacter freundii]QMJ12097.1 GtrA family protein [Citrobacter freundii]TKU37596.1 GtrA family protein [Citrobacter sp. wls718]